MAVLRLLLAFFSVWAIAFADVPRQPELRITQNEHAPVERGDTLWLSLDIEIDGGYMLAAPDTGSAGLLPLRILFDKSNDLTLDSPRFTPPHMPLFNGNKLAEVYVLPLHVEVPVRVSAMAQPGPIVLKGRVQYQPLDRDTTLLKQERAFSLTVDVNFNRLTDPVTMAQIIEADLAERTVLGPGTTHNDVVIVTPVPVTLSQEFQRKFAHLKLTTVTAGQSYRGADGGSRAEYRYEEFRLKPDGSVLYNVSENFGPMMSSGMQKEASHSASGWTIRFVRMLFVS